MTSSEEILRECSGDGLGSDINWMNVSVWRRLAELHGIFKMKGMCFVDVNEFFQFSCQI